MNTPSTNPLRYMDLVAECQPRVREVMPWDLPDATTADGEILLVDVREPAEFAAMHIVGSVNVPRGILEPACEYGFEETVPELVAARDREIVVICRSGYRSVLAAHTLIRMGYRRVASLKTGLKGWNDYELPLVDAAGTPVSLEDADGYFTPRLRPEQLAPTGTAGKSAE